MNNIKVVKKIALTVEKKPIVLVLPYLGPCKLVRNHKKHSQL